MDWGVAAAGVAGATWGAGFHHSVAVGAGAFFTAAASTLPVDPLLIMAREKAQMKKSAPRT